MKYILIAKEKCVVTAKMYSCLGVAFLLFLLCVQLLFRLVPAVVLTLETSEVSAIFIFTTKTTQPRHQVFSVTVPYL